MTIMWRALMSFGLFCLPLFHVGAQNNWAVKRAKSSVSSLYVSPKTTDIDAIKLSVKSNFAKWCEKGEFEKVAAVEDRLRNESKNAFDKICYDAIVEKARSLSSSIAAQDRKISTYDSEKETFMISLLIHGVQESFELNVPISIAPYFKLNFPTLPLSFGKTWGLLDGNLYPKILVIEDKSIGFSTEVHLGNGRVRDLEIAYDDLSLPYSYLKRYVFGFKDFADSNVTLTLGYNNFKCFDVVDEMPSFPGGQGALMSYLASNVKYPTVAQENGVQGRVIVSFIVEKDGSLTDIQVSRSVDPALDREAMRVVKYMPKWKPGKNHGIPVRVKYTVPVVFRLS